ncbi:MFS transporter [Agrobacterium leguminum]|uniref:MFS transporter n=1 Tax=Agrobacterium leguminum TaxID=2792015 RepID=UPI00272CEDE7|nr:MFS transporter [Agrobacterium leguminum]WLD96334.1 MFS transporter [Agrobacterium leguminum]
MKGNTAQVVTIWKISSVAVLGSFLAQIDATMLSTALPVLASDLKTGISVVQWVVTGYLLAMVVGLPMAGVLVERIGARRLYLACYVGFGASALLCAFAWSAGSLIAFRVLHGLVGGLMAPLAQMMIAQAAGERMARVAGYAAIPILIGPILGPVLAGLILSQLSWHWLFAITALISGIGFYLAYLFLPRDQPNDGALTKKMDWTGLLLLSPGLALLLSSLDRIASATGLAMLAVSVLLLTLFVRHLRRRGSAALINPDLLRIASLRAAALTQFLTYGVNTACQILLPVFLVTGLGLPLTKVGLYMAPLGLGLLCAYPVMGRAVERFGPRRIALGGNSASLVAIALAIVVAGELSGTMVLPISLFLLGVGQGATGIAAVAAGYGSVPKASLPSATTILNISQRLGGPVLATLCGTLLGWLQQGQTAAAPHPQIFLTVFAILWATLALCAVASRGLPNDVARNEKQS